MQWDPNLIAIVAAVAFLGLGIGVVIGRRSGAAAKRARELGVQLEAEVKQRELTQASLEAARADVSRLETEHQQYREQVVGHFRGASDLMRDLTIQYRAVYEHLTDGATGLCPPGSVGLQEGLSVEQLATGAGESPGAEDPEAESERPE